MLDSFVNHSDRFTVKNAGKRAMVEAISEFGRKLARADVGLFFYAGHGMQVRGRNYLIPIGARVETESDVEFESVDAGRLLAKMEDAGNRVNIVILDACRDNPFARSFRSGSRGLVRMRAPKGSFIAYATEPGSVAADGRGRNSPFTAHLLKYIKDPGLKIEDVFKRVRAGVTVETKDKQLPWQSSSLIGDFYFVPGKPTAAGATTGRLAEERARLEAERQRLAEEQQLLEERRRLAEERKRLEEERRRIEQGRQQTASIQPSSGVKTATGLVKYPNGIIYDPKTGLEWYVGPDSDTTWDQARS